MTFSFQFGERISQPKSMAPILEATVEIPVKETILFHGEIIDFLDFTLFKRESHDIDFELIANDVTTLPSDSDLVTNVYEGGLKTWECSIDLVKLLTSLNLDFAGMSIIELGCGSGLPGIYCMKQNAKRVDFQDYNLECLKFVTIPNVFANLIVEAPAVLNSKIFEVELNIDCDATNSKFFAGDWAKLDDSGLMSEKYDLVLTSETIYDSNSYVSLLRLMKNVVKPNGIVLVAAKAVYFGCSGSIQSFKDVCQHEHPLCEIETVFINEVNVRREVLRIRNIA